MAVEVLIPILVTIVTGVLQLKTLREIHRLKLKLSQSVQQLHRARDLVARLHIDSVCIILRKAHKVELEPTEQNLLLGAKHSAEMAELRGLAFAIGDKKLLALVCEGYRFVGVPDEERFFMSDEMDVRGRSQRLYIRIYQLLTEVTK